MVSFSLCNASCSSRSSSAILPSYSYFSFNTFPFSISISDLILFRFSCNLSRVLVLLCFSSSLIYKAFALKFSYSMLFITQESLWSLFKSSLQSWASDFFFLRLVSLIFLRVSYYQRETYKVNGGGYSFLSFIFSSF